MSDDLVLYNKRELTKKAELVGAGVEAIGELYVYTNEVFRKGTRQVVEKTGVIEDDSTVLFGKVCRYDIKDLNRCSSDIFLRHYCRKPTRYGQLRPDGLHKKNPSYLNCQEL